MYSLSKRQLLALAGAAVASAALPRAVRAATPAPRVVVVGGGFGGATVAKYLKLWGGEVRVTLVEPNPSHVSCILSNLAIADILRMDRLDISYSSLKSQHGVTLLQGRATGIDPIGARVTVSRSPGDEVILPYDRLVLAPGIDFIAPAGTYDPEKTPHAWQAGRQTLLLKDQLASMPDGGLFVINVPRAPFRCPPAPYERACLVADYFKRAKPRSRVLVLDENPGIVVERRIFSAAFNQTYAGYIEYRAGVTVTGIDSNARTLGTNQGDVTGAVLNYLPDQKAGRLIVDAGLANDPSARWAMVDPRTYGSTRHPSIHVIGDSQATGQSKSGHMANAQAKVCADAILRAFAGEAPDPEPTTNSACYSAITSGTASWVTGVFRYDPATGAMARVAESAGEASSATSANYREMLEWADNLFADSFK